MGNTFKIGLYSRVSTEEQAENPEGSIKNQEQRLRDYVKFKNGDGHWGDIVECFIDAGISAKDMQRPQLQRLLAKIRSKEINLVLVTDLSRFTRSTKDFSFLWDFMHENDCKFQSLRENFDSTTAAGEMIMFTLANFAQFERRQTAERISAAFVARAKRGLYNGGSVPLGFQISKDKPGLLEIDEEDAEIVRLVFQTFLKEGTVSLTCKALNDKGVRLKRKVNGGGAIRAGFFKVDTVYRILTNKSYIGMRQFSERKETKVSKASWPAIIDEGIFERVQKILAKNKSAKKPHSKTRYPYLLSGFTFCKHCGDRMAGKSAHGKSGKVAYYEHSWATKNNSVLSKKIFNCEPHRVLAKKLEPVVWDSVKEFLSNPEVAQAMLAQASKSFKGSCKSSEADKLKAKASSIKFQIEALAERIACLPKSLDPSPFYDQMERLQGHKLEFEEKLRDAASKTETTDRPIDLDSFIGFQKSLKTMLEKEGDPVIKTQIIQKVVERILVSTEGVEIYFYLGANHYKRELDLSGSRSFFMSKSGASSSSATVLDFKAKRAPSVPHPKTEKLFVNLCSNSLTNGGGAGN